MTIYEYYSGLSEVERRELVGKINGSLEYGLTKTFPRLPQAAKDVVTRAYQIELNRIKMLPMSIGSPWSEK